jgi:glycerol-3-phosphate dehydrogenase
MKENGHVIGVQAECVETGRQLEIRAHCVINATGVFVDAVRHMDDPQAQAIVAPSQGVHLVLPREFLPGDSAIMIPKTDDGRVLFAVPWHGRVIIGTTDTPVHHATLEPRALPDEIAFLMQHAARYLTRDPHPSDVLSIYAGLRPLVAMKKGEATAALSRDHTILVADSGLITITGGKWTTYRRMAEDVIDHAEMVGGFGMRHCITPSLKIHGSATVLDPHDPLAVYGSDAAEIRALALQQPELAGQVHPRLALTCAEVIFHTRHEMARTVEDVLSRRSRSLLLDAQASMSAAPRVAALMATELGWTPARTTHEVDHFQKLACGYILEG